MSNPTQPPHDSGSGEREAQEAPAEHPAAASLERHAGTAGASAPDERALHESGSAPKEYSDEWLIERSRESQASMRELAKLYPGCFHPDGTAIVATATLPVLGEPRHATAPTPSQAGGFEKLKADLQDPVKVHAAMLRGQMLGKAIDWINGEREATPSQAVASALQATAVPAAMVRYLQDTLQEGTAAEQGVAKTALAMLAAAPAHPVVQPGIQGSALTHGDLGEIWKLAGGSELSSSDWGAFHRFARELAARLAGSGHQAGASLLLACDSDESGFHTPWRCFHCDETFTDAESARLHFGRSEREAPSCQVSPEALRELEAELARYREEDTDLHREIHRMQSAHQTALRREEEKGYARGLRDAKAHPGEVA